MWFLLLATACSPKPATDDSATDSAVEGDTDTDTDADTDTDTDSDTDADTATIPDDPRPLTITVSGTYSGSLTFDAPTCSWYDGVPNFRSFWRSSTGDHVFVLIAEVIGSFDGSGTYDETMGRIDVKLQEEAYGNGNYFGTDATAGDTASITVESVDAEDAWGSFSFNRLSDGSGGSVTVAPQPIPIWCPTMN